jgi:muramoyltetrapeptide carboxypeptidase
MRLVKPKRLKKGDKLRIVAPASSIDVLEKKAVERGVENLEKLGLEIEIRPQVFRRHGHSSGIPEERANDLMTAFTDPEVDGIMAAWGGWNSSDILDLLDYEKIHRNPKVFIGYSDITSLSAALLQKAGLVNFQGPAFVTFTHSHLMSWEVEDFKKAVMSTDSPRTLYASPTYIDDPYYYLHPEKPPQEAPNPGWKAYKRGTAKGPLMGGHLGTLLSLAGTTYWPRLEGKILFVEEDEEGGPTGNIARKFRQLEQTGVFKDIAALLIGRLPAASGLKEGDSLEMILNECLRGYNFPVATGFDFGHTNPIATIPIGVKAVVDVDACNLVYLESGVKK